MLKYLPMSERLKEGRSYTGRPKVPGDTPYVKLGLRLERSELVDRVVESVEYARKVGERIKVYRFGFFRLQFVPTRLAEGHSLHVWSPELFDGRDEAPHNHNSFMRSRILLGRITNYFWDSPEVSSDGLWRPTETICTDTACEDRPADYLVNCVLLSTKTYGPGHLNGDYYEIPHGSVHSTKFEPGTVTLIHKSEIDPGERITNLLPRNRRARLEGFDITSYPQAKAWSAVDDAIDRLKASR